MTNRQGTAWTFLLLALAANPVLGQVPPPPFPPPPVGLPPATHTSAPWPAPEALGVHPQGVASRVEKREDETNVLFGAEYLLLAPRRGGQDFAIVGTNPSWGPQGTVKSLDGSYDSGFRLAAGYLLPGRLDVTGRYTYFHSAADQSLTRGRGQSIFPTLTHPSVAAALDSAAAGNNVNLNLIDLELGKTLDFSDAVAARVFAGPRYANLEQKLSAVYLGNRFHDDVRRRLTFNGGGLRAGGEANWKLLDLLGVYFRGSASLLTGRFHSDLAETANGSTIVNVTERYTRVVPIVDLGLGLSYQHGGLRLSVGYEFSQWFGAFDAVDFGDDAQPAKLNRKTSDVGFDGVVFRAEWTF